MAGYFTIYNTEELIARKYYWLRLYQNSKAYIRGCDILLASKTFCHKSEGDLWSLPLPTHYWKDLCTDFVTALLLLINWNYGSYNLILIIVDCLIKMVYYKLAKMTVYKTGFAEMIINIVIRHPKLLKSIISNKSSILILKISFLRFYFHGIK